MQVEIYTYTETGKYYTRDAIQKQKLATWSWRFSDSNLGDGVAAETEFGDNQLMMSLEVSRR